MKYILMHRELPVAVLSINDTSGTVYRVEDVVQPAHLPIGLFSADRREFAKNAYHSGQPFRLSPCAGGPADPEKTTTIRQYLDDEVFALSLSDQYWLNPAEQPLEWRKVNFYHNDFSEDVGNILFGQIPERDSIDLVSPCNTSDGWLKKKWKILNGQRVLVKGGSGMAQQEPFNEAAASLLCRKLGIPHVEYSLLFEGSQPYSVCTNMTTDRQDFVSGYYIFSAFPRGDGVSAYAHFLNCCEKLGIPDVTEQLQQMMILDYLICNQDRHFGNFGAIRDAVTLDGWALHQFLTAAPACGLTNMPPKSTPWPMPQPNHSLPHSRNSLRLQKSLQTLDLTALDGCKDDVLAIFEQAHFGEPNRAQVLADALAARCKFLKEDTLV